MDLPSSLGLFASLITISSPLIVLLWRQHKKIISLEKKLRDIESKEIIGTGNYLVDSILPNIELVKSKISSLIRESKNCGRPLRIDHFGLDFETIVPMFRFTFINKIAQREIIYRGLIIDPIDKKIEKSCGEESKISQSVARNSINQVRDLIREVDSSISIQITSYNQLPVIHGFLIDDEHLLLGFTHFEGENLDGGSSPYIYIKRDKKNELKESLFTTYKSWFNFWCKNGTKQVPQEHLQTLKEEINQEEAP